MTEMEKLVKEFKQEVREKAIDEFAERIMEYCSMSDMNRKMIEQIAEQLKGDEK